MLKKLAFAGAMLCALGLNSGAHAQQAIIVSTCGALSLSQTFGGNPLYMDTTGNLCTSGSGGSGGTVSISQTTPGTTNGVQTNSGSTTTLQDSGGTNITDATNHVLNVNVKNNGVLAGTTSTGASYAPTAALTQTNCNAQSLTTAQLNPTTVDLKGNLCASVKPMVSGVVTGTSSQATGGTSTSLVGAVASQSLWITSYSCSNSGASASLVSFQDGNGGTTLWTALVPAGGGNNLGGTMPMFKTSSGNALYFSPATSSTTVYCSASGFSQ